MGNKLILFITILTFLLLNNFSFSFSRDLVTFVESTDLTDSLSRFNMDLGVVSSDLLDFCMLLSETSSS
uniref:Uncharacterized protein n=1 Tax=Pararge aegeria TaxID=116150 RepID=S4P132_9NEOP